MTSQKTAKVFVTSSGFGSSSSTRIMPVGGTYVASTSTSTGMPFDDKDQEEFARSLRTELVRLGVVATPDPAGRADLTINVHFVRATLKTDYVEYTLDVDLQMSGGDKPARKQYHIVSGEKDSMWEKFNTNGAEARVKAARLLLEKLVPDIEAYVATAK